MAVRIVTDSYPDARIELVDSRSNCMQLGFAAARATIPLHPLGAVIGLHVGPGTVGVVYRTNEELT